MHNPEKHAPKKMDIEKIQKGLSKSQMEKIAYECDLMRMSPEKLLYIAPFLFIDKITSANTRVSEQATNKAYDNSEYEYPNSYPDEWEGD